MPKSDYLARAIVNHIFCGPSSPTPQSPFPQPSGLYVALYTVAPLSSGGGSEVVGGSYSRQQALFSPSSLIGESANVATVSFPTASADWGTLVAFSLFDAPTAGNMLCFNSLPASITILTGDRAGFPPGVLTVKEL